MINLNPLKFWTVDGFEISSFNWRISQRMNSTHNYSGSDNTGECTYTYNELGFRGDSIYKQGFKVMSIGCSNTEGIGLNYQDTWPYSFSKKIPNFVNLNFGTGGRSNDFISRCLLTYYDLIQPDLVLIMYTSPQRREVYVNNGGIEPFMPSAAWGYFGQTEDGIRTQKNLVDLQNDDEDFINWYKNHLLIKNFLEVKKCNWIWNGWMGVPEEYFELNRFDGDYGSFLDRAADGKHPGPLHNRTYSFKLIKYIREQHPSFIPADTNLNKPQHHSNKLF